MTSPGRVLSILTLLMTARLSAAPPKADDRSLVGDFCGVVAVSDAASTVGNLTLQSVASAPWSVTSADPVGPRAAKALTLADRIISAPRCQAPFGLTLARCLDQGVNALLARAVFERGRDTSPTSAWVGALPGVFRFLAAVERCEGSPAASVSITRGALGERMERVAEAPQTQPAQRVAMSGALRDALTGFLPLPQLVDNARRDFQFLVAGSAAALGKAGPNGFADTIVRASERLAKPWWDHLSTLAAAPNAQSRDALFELFIEYRNTGQSLGSPHEAARTAKQPGQADTVARVLAMNLIATHAPRDTWIVQTRSRRTALERLATQLTAPPVP